MINDDLFSFNHMKQTFGFVDSGMLGFLALTKRPLLLAFLALFGICHQWLLAFGQVKEHSEDSYVFVN